MTGRGDRRPLAVLAGALLILGLVAPLVPLAVWSLARSWRFPDLVPQVWSLQAWELALAPRSGLAASFGTTLAIAAAATVMAVLAGVPAGWALARARFRGKALVEMILLAPIVVPGLAAAMGLHAVFLWLGLTNGAAGVALVHLTVALPYVILVMAGVFANLDPEAAAQARSLGASAAQAFRHVTLPAVLPGVLVAAPFAFLVSFGQYALTLMIGGGRVITLPVLMFNAAAAGRNDLTGALALVTLLPGALVLLVVARHLTGQPAALRDLGRR
jgi:putative spermidine/putrescine transport system permease protein